MFAIVVIASFCAVFLLAMSAALVWREHRLAARLSRIGAPLPRPASPGSGHLPVQAARLVAALSRLSTPDAGLQDSALRVRLAGAGLRNPRAPLIFYALRTVCTLLLPLICVLLLPAAGSNLSATVIALLVVALAVVGYLLPDIALRVHAARRREALRESLPDMVDLLLVCVESGLALDGAINRVCREIAVRSPALAEEFHLAALEIRAGARRVDALHNLATRCGVDEIGSLVSMLVQSERFGTGLGDALRVHADFMRVRRVQRAEEQAATIPLKILFPLILLIFPSLLVVILGPAMIRLPQFLGSS
jgi:tight adherence protein C